MPSMLMSKKTRPNANPSILSGTNPMADSRDSANNITACTIAGSGKSRAGRAGRPIVMEDRDKKTVD